MDWENEKPCGKLLLNCQTLGMVYAFRGPFCDRPVSKSGRGWKGPYQINGAEIEEIAGRNGRRTVLGKGTQPNSVWGWLFQFLARMR